MKRSEWVCITYVYPDDDFRLATRRAKIPISMVNGVWHVEGIPVTEHPHSWYSSQRGGYVVGKADASERLLLVGGSGSVPSDQR